MKTRSQPRPRKKGNPDLHRQIEEAFLLTKRLLGLAYLWVGHRNGVQIQILSTLIFYTVLNRLVGDVAIALNQPKEKISVEMVFRSVYYVAKAVLRGEDPDVVSYLAELFGLVKAERKRHRERDALSGQIWQAIPLSLPSRRWGLTPMEVTSPLLLTVNCSLFTLQ